MEREEGYYWVKMKNLYNEWQPARWDDESWWVIGTEEEYNDTDISEVGERIREPKFSKEEKQDIAVFVCVVIAWVGMEISGVL